MQKEKKKICSGLKITNIFEGKIAINEKKKNDSNEILKSF